jgi:hypothetical protein
VNLLIPIIFSNSDGSCVPEPPPLPAKANVALASNTCPLGKPLSSLPIITLRC